MMTGAKYDMQMLNKISQIDAPLALKKGKSEEAVFKYVFDYAEYAAFFLGKYDGNGIYDNHTQFLDDIAELKERAGKLYATTVIWDADALIKAFKTGKRDDISDKFENFKMSADSLLKHINRSKCDEEGKPPKPQRDEQEDTELASQPECGKAVRGNFAPIDTFKKIASLVDALEFDDATSLLRKASAVYYNENVNIEMKKLIWIMKMGEFEKSSASARVLLEAAIQHNETVKADSEIVKPRVLVVDDVPDMLLTVKGILYDMCHVCTVTNHVSAMRFLENCHADLILLDIGLNEVDGFELLERIRKIKKYEKTPVIFLTGNVSREDILRAIDAGVSDYLRKPIDAAMLISRVKKRLDNLKLPQHTA